MAVAYYVIQAAALRRERVFRERSNPFDANSNEQFRQRYRLSKESALRLNELLSERLECATNRSNSVSSQLKIFVFLRFLSTGGFYSAVGDLHGISKETTYRIVKQVACAVASLHSQYIVFSEDHSSMRQRKLQFYNIAQFPRILGAIDCTHIRLVFNVNPAESRRFINRHHYHSVNTQVVCDANFRIINIVARWPGSVHDSRVWNNCSLHGDFESGQFDGWLLGDAGYPCMPFVLTPLLSPTTPAERRYNQSHVKSRSIVERTFGMWKRRFPCLKYGLRTKIQTATTIIVAAAVLHNICLENREDDFRDDEENDAPTDVIPNLDTNAAGNAVRRRLINTVFQ